MFKVKRIPVFRNFARYLIEPEHREPIPFKSTIEWTTPPTGQFLPPVKGFSFNITPPKLCFKTYRALANVGLTYELDQTLQRRARSHVTPDYVWDAAQHFLDKTASRTKSPEYLNALERFKKYLDVETKIDPVSLREACDGLPQSTSPGLPFINTHPGLKKGDVIDKYFRSFDNYWSRVGQGKVVSPLPHCAGFARSHISDPTKNKVRLIWAVPILVVSAEARFGLPLTQLFTSQTLGHNTGFGMEMMKGGMAWVDRQVRQASLKYGSLKYLMTDYTRFDSTIPAWLIRDIFNIIKTKFNLTPSDDLIFSKLIKYFINTTVVNMDGRCMQKDHGVPSGSMFTNLIDTFCNMIITWTVSDIVLKQQPVFEVFFGDDALVAYKESAVIDLDMIQSAAKYHFGVEVNTTKSYFTEKRTNIHFLGYFNKDGSPVKPLYELLSSMLFPQYNHDEWSYCISRALGCLLVLYI